ncbi:MAG TPA: radical SAM protein [Desulfurococcales archaeon]|nr:radical SAM protein [Desulfurococcales archaeon]
MEYPRMLSKGFKPFDPLWLAKVTEEIVCNGDSRKYTSFYATGVYGGIATGYAVGCCLRCFFCWSNWSRDFPELYGKFYSAEDAYKNIAKAARIWNVKRARISGCEPTLCRDHLVKLLEYFERDNRIELFILETNGIMFGTSKNYVKEISQFEKVHVRVSLKAGYAKAFTARTGAVQEAFTIPFEAIKNLLKYNVRFHVAAMTDPRIMPKDERVELIKKLIDINEVVAANLEEEICDPYDTTIVRMYIYGIDPVAIFKRKPELH